MAKSANKAKTPAKRPAVAAAGGMTLEVCDFGPIARGKIDLRPLTVFAGPSNTGKSWMATLIYVLGQYRLFCTRGLPRYGLWPAKPAKNKNLLSLDTIRGWHTALGEGGNIQPTPGEMSILRRAVEAFANETVADELRRCYGVAELSALARHHSEGRPSVKFRLGLVGHSLGLSGQGKNPLRVTFPPQVEIPVAGYKGETARSWRRLADGAENAMITMAGDDLYRFIAEKLMVVNSTGKAGNMHYLPADRGGIMRSYSVVVSALIKGASRAGADSEATLTGASADLMEKIVTIAARLKAVGERKDESASKLLEDEILRGKINLHLSPTGYPVFSYQPNDWEDRELPLIATSSMVSELSPVVLYLRYYTAAGDTLIIDEPEAHLHPAAQRRFIEEVVSWVKAGIRVVLTTHSEWILEALSTIVCRGEFKKKPTNGLAYLDKKDVGVWLFDHLDPDDPTKGSKIAEVPWNPDEAGYEAGFYDTGIDSHNDWASAINRLNGGGVVTT